MGLGWGVPFLWAGIWAAVTVPWVQAVMHKETVSWEEESAIMTATMPAPPPMAPGAYQGSESLDSAETAVGKPENELGELNSTKDEHRHTSYS